MSLHLFIRSLNRCGQEISVLERTLEESFFDTIEPVETFTEIDTPLAIVKTIDNREKLFDGINISSSATHIFCVLYTTILEQVEHHNYFIDLNLERYKILAVTNIDERNDVLAFQAVKRGDDALEAAEA